MPSTPSTRLRVELQALGENLNTWGDTRLNAALQRLEEAIADVTSQDVGSSDWTPTSTNYVADQSRSAAFILTGTLTGARVVTVPTVEKLYLIDNQTTQGAFTLTVKTAAGSGYALRPGPQWVYCNGTDVARAEPRMDQIPLPTSAVAFNSQNVTGVGTLTIAGALSGVTTLAMNGVLSGMATPSATTDGANKAYVDAAIASAVVGLPSQVGNSGKYLTTDGSAPSWGTITLVTNWTESVNSSAPNATVPVVRWLATNAASNVDAAITPKGTGALVAQIPDSAAAGGNKRGANAVDWQTSRSSAANVASGANAVVIGGNNNRASGSTAFVGGGDTNLATGNLSGIAGGSSNTASGTSAFIGGGSSNQANGQSSWIPGGSGASTRSIIGAGAFASSNASANGDRQVMFLHVRGSVAAASTINLTSDGSAAGTTNQMVLPDDSTYLCKVLVVARRTDADGESAGYELTAVIDRNSGVGTTALVGSVTKAVIAEDTAAWDANLQADATNGALQVTFTGEAAKTIAVCALITAVQIVG
jgi:hypothetical protein